MSDGKCLEIVEGSPLTFATALECEQFYANDNYFSGSTISAETGEDDLPWPFGDGPKRQLIDKMSANRLSLKMKGGIYELGDGDIITTHRAFSPTIAFRLTAKTNLYELRFAYIEKEMIFNWGSNANQFRIGEVPGTREEDKGPFDGKHVDGKGNIPIDTWVRIDVVVTETSFRVLVEGKERFFGEADMSGYKDSFRVYTWGLSKVSVRSLVEQRPD
jgi:hypothetical protein